MLKLTCYRSQIARALHPRREDSRYVLCTEVNKSGVPAASKELYERIWDLIVHKTQLEHQVSKREIISYIRR